MMFARLALAACLLILSGASRATVVPMDGGGSWKAFDVSEDLSGGKAWIDLNDGSPLSFTFTIDAGNVGVLTVVDTGYAGDTFNVSDGATLLGATSPVPVGVYPGVPGISDPDAALADPSFSRAAFVLGAGSYSIIGVLDQSVLSAIGGPPLNSTSGDIRLDVSPVPEPSTLASLAVGIGLIAVALRRRSI
jgi:hypothetical protein